MRLGQWISVIALVISVYIVWQIRQVLLLVFAAAVIATVLNRLVRLLQRGRIPRGVAIAITVALLFLLLVLFSAIVGPRLAAQVQEIGNILPLALEQLRIWYDWVQSRIPGAMLQEEQGFVSLLQNLQAWIGQLLSNFFFLIGNSVNVFLSLLLFIAATIMFLINPTQYRHVFVLGFPAFYRHRIHEILDKCELALVGWIRATLTAMAAIAALSYIGLLILQVPLPLVNALIAGFLEFIPNVGPTLSVVPPALLSLLDAPWKTAAVIGFYILIQQFESFVLTPMVMKHEVSLLPLFTVLSVVVFSLFFGFLGLFLAIPLLIVVQIWLREVLVKDVLNQWQHPPSMAEEKYNQIL